MVINVLSLGGLEIMDRAFGWYGVAILVVEILLEVCMVFHGQRCRTHFGEFGGVSVEVIGIAIDLPSLSGQGIRD